MEILIERYQPQMHWQMSCTGAINCAFSVIMGANEPIVEYIERDNTYIAEMVKRGRQFMDFVERLIPPVVLPPAPLPVAVTKDYDMTGNNMWAVSADMWIRTREAKVQNVDAEKILKSIVPADAEDVRRLAAVTSGSMDKAPFRSPIEDFYMTDPIARASAVMAECSRLAHGRMLTAAE